MRTAIILTIITAGTIQAATQTLETDGITIRPYLVIEGKEVFPDDCHMDCSDTKIRVSFTPPRDGRYRFGLAIEAKEITPLAPLMPKYDSKFKSQNKSFRNSYFDHFQEAKIVGN